MSDDRTSNQEAAENKMICDWLGWKRCGKDECTGWVIDSFGHHEYGTPDFTEWVSAGLILDVLAARGIQHEYWWKRGTAQFLIRINEKWTVVRQDDNGPLAIRAAIIDCIKSMPT